MIFLSGVISCKKETKPAEASARTIIDHDGKSVTIPNQVNRVLVASVFPLPSVLTVFLGSPEKLVGIPPASLGAAKAGLLGEIFPEFLNIPTNFLANNEINVEEVLKLNPDLIFTGSIDQKVKEELENAGISTVTVSANNWNYNILETYDAWIELLSEIFPEAAKKDKVSEYSKKVHELIQSRVANIPDEQKKKGLFLFQCNDKSIVTSGKLFFGQSWCDLTGAKNVAEEIGAENSNAVVNIEQIYQWDPDVILITNFTPQTPEDLYNNKGPYDWSPLSAIKNKNVYKMPLGTYRSYTPSADTPVTLYWMAKTIYPELFEDIDIIKEVKSYFKEMYSIELTDEQIERMYNQGANGASGVKLQL